MALKGPRIKPRPLQGRETVTQLIDGWFHSYNGGRLREACALMKEKILRPEVTVGVSLSGALTPPGYGVSVIAPLIQAGFIDYIVSTGANLYHDMHYALGMKMHHGSPFTDDVMLRRKNIIRVYDVLFDFDVLHQTDRYLYTLLRHDEFLRKMSTSELHHLLGRYLVETQRQTGIKTETILTSAYKCGVPIYTSSPGDSTIGMNVAAINLFQPGPEIDVALDVNESSALVYHAKRRKKGMSAVVIFGGGSPKNFLLQTEPQIQEILGLSEKGHDYFIQFTDARPDTGGLSGATPSEAVSWGKIDPKKLPDTVVCYTDSTIALPLVGAYALANCKKRKLSRLYDRREELLKDIQKEYLKHSSTFTGPQASGR